MQAVTTPRRRLAIELGVIALLAIALYGPFVGNPRVFDDRVFFSGQGFADYALTPFGLDMRMPAYFTLAFTEVLWPRIEVHRIVSLLFHLACAGVLYRLLRRLFGEGSPLAFAGAAVFAVHPVAVYAAGYLVQRSIVLATLFSLLSVVLFVRGLDRGSHADACSAALMYWLAVLCKEHAILLPAAVALAVPLAARDPRFKLRHAAIYLAACAPVALFVVLRMKFLIGTPYETAFEAVTSQIEDGARSAFSDEPWLSSAVLQMGLYFKYLALWLVPGTRWMSIDVRIDFAATASLGWSVLKVVAFFGYAIAGVAFLRRGGRLAVLGFGLLWPWVLFLVELSSVRFQEPFVLYRSYLWAPGILVALAAALSYLPRRAALGVAVAAIPVLVVQAYDRLESFSSPLALWEDAAAKLPPGVPGGSRTLFHLGRELLYTEQPERALAVADRCIAEYPQTPQCYLARGTILLQLERYADALPYLARTIELDPRSGVAHHHRGFAFQELGERQAAIDEYRQSAKLGFGAAAYRLRLLKERVDAD
jgi:hypothetical protein